MFLSLFGSLLSHLYHYANENVSVKLLSLICMTSILTNIYSLVNCSVYGRSCCNYSLKSFGFFWKKLCQVEGENRNVIHQPRSVLGRENLCPLSGVPPPAYCLSPAVLKTSGTVFPNTDLPAGE